MSNAPSSFGRRWILYTLVAGVFAGGVWYFGIRKVAPTVSAGSPWRSNSMAPTPVRAVPTTKQDLAVHLRAIGTVAPVNTVTVRSRVEGQLLQVAFTEGQEVVAGQLLAEIDPTPYRLRLAQMEGQLRQSESQARTAQNDLERFKQLHAQTLISSQQLEGQQALVSERLGVLAAEQAQVEDARRQLAYTRIEAPIAGRLGLRQVDAGNLVRPGEAGGLVVITQTRPISVMFTIPELDLQKVIEPLRAGEVLTVEAWDRGENVVLATGALRTVDNQIDLATGTLRLKAEFPNTDERLFPNQFVNVRLRVRTLKDTIVIPAVGVQFGSRGPYAFVVGAENKVAVRDLVLGPVDGAMQAVIKGISPGELVVTEGVDRLREGRPVTIISGESAPPLPPAPPAAPGSGKGAPDGTKKKKKSGA
ncbi:MAG: multidrug transporter subunit MdtA [Opitutia bacterium]|nr:efflux RND transporter periplasmic adaptor subunit [Opitutaceae bacterium]PHX87139.1 MAG: multidrug transporter subunit MdtA [Opitutae bacterium]